MKNKILHPEILKRTKEKIQNQDFDGAIFDATTYLEARLQEITYTKTINTRLVKESFETNKIRISNDNSRNLGAQNLFDGAFLLIRNDRAHDKDTEIKAEISCDNEADCLKYLAFISLLMLFLERNLIDRPSIDTISVGQHIELRGQNFTQGIKVIVNQGESRILNFDPIRIIIPLPSEPNGTIKVKKGNLLSNSIKYSIPPTGHANRYKILETYIDLYSDKECTSKREGVFGVKMMVYESGKVYPRISPTKSDYSIGDYVLHQFKMEGEGCNETWYRDPLDSGTIKYAWSGSALFEGKVIGKAKLPTPIKLTIRPEKIISGVNESRILRAIVTDSDEILYMERDVSREAEWKSEDENIAYIDDKGFLKTKSLGKTNVFCKYKGLHNTVSIDVITPATGTKVKYFSSDIRRYQQIRFDSKDNLYVSNQSPIIYKITTDGYLDEILHLPPYEDPQYGLSDYPPSIDCLAIDSNDQIYINCNQPRCVYKVDTTLEEIKRSSKPLKSIEIDTKGTIYIADMEKELIKMYPDGNEEIIPIQITSVDLKLLDDDRIIVGSAGGGDIMDLYSTKDGTLLKRTSSPQIKGPSDIAVFNGEIYVLTFHGGEVFKLDLDGDQHKKIAEGLSVGGGIDFDSLGNICVSVFDSGDSSQIGIYKIYM